MNLLALLFSGGIVTKLAMIAISMALLGSGASCAFKARDLSETKKEVVALTKKNGELSTDNIILKQNIKTVKENNKVLEDANTGNLKANRELLAERKSAKDAVDVLAKSQTKNRADLASAKLRIEEMLKTPSNDGAISPVLRETIRDIQGGNKK